MLSNALLSASYPIFGDSDEGGVQVATSSSQGDHDEKENGPPLFFAPIPVNFAAGLLKPVGNVPQLYPIRVAYSPPSRAPPALAL
jgi:hypothetical protein